MKSSKIGDVVLVRLPGFVLDLRRTLLLSSGPGLSVCEAGNGDDVTVYFCPRL